MILQMNLKYEKKCTPIILSKDHKYKVYWDTFTNIFFIYTYVMIPYNIAFEKPSIDN